MKYHMVSSNFQPQFLGREVITDVICVFMYFYRPDLYITYSDIASRVTSHDLLRNRDMGFHFQWHTDGQGGKEIGTG
jgi:hypothetical protein